MWLKCKQMLKIDYISICYGLFFARQTQNHKIPTRMLKRFALFSIYTQTEKERNVHVCRFEVLRVTRSILDGETFVLGGGGGGVEVTAIRAV